MEVSVENAGGLARRVTVQVPAERIESEVESRLQSMSRTARVDGFRAGKVPRKVVEKKFGRQIRQEVINHVVSATLQEALSKENLRPVGNPAIEQTSSSPGEPLEYVASFEVYPSLQGAINYNFTVTRPVVELRDEDVDGMLENLRRQRATWNTVDRSAQDGDRVTIDFEGSIEGQPFPGNKASDLPVILGSGSMIKGFEEQLRGLSAGDAKQVEVDFPADYPAAEVAGKHATFEVRVQAVAEMTLPTLDDGFAEAFGVRSGGLAGFREDVSNNMRRELKGLIASRIKEQVFNGLLGCNPIEVPGNLVAQDLEALRRQENMHKRPESELSALAERRVKLGVLISELARSSQISIDMVETIASSYETPDEVVQWYYSNREMLSGVQSSVLEEQVAEWVIEHTGVEVVDQPLTFNQLVEEARRTQGLQP
jgi:trigger factor